MLDVHTHTFNGLYLPLKQIVRGKRDKAGVGSILLPDQLVDVVTGAIAAETLRRQEGKALPANDPEVRDCALSLRGAGEITDRLTIGQTRLARLLFSVFSEHTDPDATGNLPEGSLLKDGRPAPRTSLSHFLHRICEPDFRQQSNFLLDCGDPEGKKIQLMVSHTMDLAPVYDQEENGVLRDFRSQVLPRMRDLAASSEGLAWFVAWNPYRDHWPHDSNARAGHAIEIVQEGISLGAMGVKFYPPSGYRPAGNEIKDLPRPLFASEPGRQWKARYPKPAEEMNRELDEHCLRLFSWCEKNDIPIFSHCSTGEFEARNGYGVHHAAPDYWIQLFRKHPELRKLRLCLAHAGGESYWFGGEKYAEWGSKVAFLCREYPNVYCDFGSHSNILSEKSRQCFSERLAGEITKPGKYDFSKKVLYGSDWFMPLGSGTFASYLMGFQSAVLDAESRLAQRGTPRAGLYEDFMLRNSLRFLNASVRKTDTRLSLSNRKVLARLLDWKPQ